MQWRRTRRDGHGAGRSELAGDSGRSSVGFAARWVDWGRSRRRHRTVREGGQSRHWSWELPDSAATHRGVRLRRTRVGLEGERDWVSKTLREHPERSHAGPSRFRYVTRVSPAVEQGFGFHTSAIGERFSIIALEQKGQMIFLESRGGDFPSSNPARGKRSLKTTPD